MHQAAHSRACAGLCCPKLSEAGAAKTASKVRSSDCAETNGAAVSHLRALHKGQAALLAGHNGDGAADLAQGLARVVLDQALDQQRLAHLHRQTMCINLNHMPWQVTAT